MIGPDVVCPFGMLRDRKKKCRGRRPVVVVRDCCGTFAELPTLSAILTTAEREKDTEERKKEKKNKRRGIF